MSATQSKSEGITLFDFLAGCAMVGVLASLDPEKDGYSLGGEVADWAISYADSLHKKILDRRNRFPTAPPTGGT